MPWNATNTQSTDQTTASAMSDVLLLDLGDPSTSQSASVRVLQSQSNANWTPGASSGSSSTDGAIVNVGGPSGLTLDVLHAQSSSSGKGSSYLLSANGNQIGSSSQANGQCQLNIPSLLSLNCLTSTGGIAGTVTSSGGEVAGATVLPNTPAQTTGDLFNATTQTNSGAAPTVSASSSGQAAATPPPAQSSGGGAQTAAPAAAGSSGALPFTGLDVAGLVGLALALGLGGVGLVWWSRRSRTSIA